jgi:hypothetical protein
MMTAARLAGAVGLFEPDETQTLFRANRERVFFFHAAPDALTNKPALARRG